MWCLTPSCPAVWCLTLRGGERRRGMAELGRRGRWVHTGRPAACLLFTTSGERGNANKPPRGGVSFLGGLGLCARKHPRTRAYFSVGGGPPLWGKGQKVLEKETLSWKRKKIVSFSKKDFPAGGAGGPDYGNFTLIDENPLRQYGWLDKVISKSGQNKHTKTYE